MAFLRATLSQGLKLNPDVEWDGSKDFKCMISGLLDLDFASICGWAVFLNGMPISMCSKMQIYMSLLFMEAELVAVTACVQDMLYSMQFMESVGLTDTGQQRI